MAYTTPTTFVNTTVFDEDDLNKFSTNDEHFNGITAGFNAPFSSLRNSNDNSLAIDNNGFSMIRTAQYLVYKVTQYSGNRSGACTIKLYDNTGTEAHSEEIWASGVSETVAVVDVGSIDLDNLSVGGASIAQGELFTARIIAAKNSAGFDIELTYLFNTDQTSIG